jgi:hypothetical protein
MAQRREQIEAFVRRLVAEVEAAGSIIAKVRPARKPSLARLGDGRLALGRPGTICHE